MMPTRNLAQLRQAQEKTQVEVAAALGMAQGDVSKLEHRADVYLSTLGRYVASLGGRLEVTAVFDDERYPIELAGVRSGL